MKNKFIKICKICLILFGVAIAILVGAAMLADEKEAAIALPPVLGIFVFLSIIAVVICMLVAALLDIFDNIKRNGYSFIPGYIAVIIVVWFVIVLLDYYIDKQGLNLIGTLPRAVLIVCGMRAGNYIFSKQD